MLIPRCKTFSRSTNRRCRDYSKKIGMWLFPALRYLTFRAALCSVTGAFRREAGHAVPFRDASSTLPFMDGVLC